MLLIAALSSNRFELSAQDASEAKAVGQKSGKKVAIKLLKPSPSPAKPVIETPKVYFPEKEQVSINADDDWQGPFVINNEPLSSILWMLEKLYQKTILRGDGLDEKLTFTFNSQGKLSRDDTVKAFVSLLALKKVAVIPIDEKFMKAVPTAKVSTHVPEFLRCKALDLPPSQDFYTKFFELKHIKVDDLESKLKTSMSGNEASSLDKFPKSNAILVTDSLVNLQRIEELIEKVDVLTQEVCFIQIHNTMASGIKERISAMQMDALKDVKLDVDTRTNKLIVVGPKHTFPIIEGIVKELDVKTDPLLKSEVVYIRHGEAAKVVEVVSKIVDAQKKSAQSKDKKPSSGAHNKTPVSSPESVVSDGKPTKEAAVPKEQSKPEIPVQGGESSGVGTDGVEFSEYVQIVSEERSNAVVIYGTPMDISQIRDIIDKLDIVLMQVKIDVIITEVSLSSDQVSGLSSFGISYGAENTPGFSGATQTYKLTDSSSPAFSVTATESSFSAIFDVARQNQNVKVLSSPTIVTTHNKEGEVNISQSVPIITSSMNDITSITTTRSSVSYQDIGIKLLVKPLVGKDGAIQLDIDQSVDSISGYTTIDNNQQPLISKRKAKSFVSVKSNEVVVMAGLQQIDTAEMDGGVWLLSDIPLIGGLFRPSKNESKRRELIIFIRPTVVESEPVEKAIAGRNIDRSKAKVELTNYLTEGDFYPNAELEDRADEFERNRPYNKALNDPVKFINGKSRGGTDR